MVSVRWGGVRTDPYNPNPKDADLDGIVQEGTFFERPVGTRFINAIGRELLSGTPGRNLGDIEGMVLVDENNRSVAYNPTWRSMRLTIAQRQRSIGQMNEPVGNMGTLSAPSMVRPVEEPPVETPSALRPLNPWNIIEGGDRIDSPRYGEDTRQRVYGRLQTSDVDLEIVDNPDNGKFQIVGSYRDPDGDPEYFYDEYEFDSIEDAQEWGLTLSAILNNDDDDADDIRDAVDELLSSNIKDPTVEDVPRNPSSLSNEDLDNTIERLDELVSQTNDYTARMDLLDRLDLHLDEREKRYKRVREGRASRDTTDRSVIDITPESIREDVGAHDWKQTRTDRDSKKSELVEEVVERFWGDEESDPWDLTAALEDFYRESLDGASEEEIQQAIDFSKGKIASGEIEPSEIFSTLLTEEQREEHIRDAFLIGKRIDLGEKVASDGKSYRIVATPELEPQRIDEDFVQVSGRFNYEVYDEKGNLVGQYTPPVFGTHTDSGFHREIDLSPVVDDDGVARPSIFNVELGASSTINFTNSDGESVSINTKGMGLADIFNANAFMFMEAMGVRRAKTTASSDGVVVWPRKGYVAQEDSEQVFETLERMTDLLNAYDEFKAGIVGGNFNSSFRIMAAAIVGDDERAERLRGMLKDFNIEKVKTYKVGEFDNIIDWDRYNEDNGVSFADVPQLGDFILALENPDGSRNSLMYAAVHDSLVNYKKGKYDDVIQDAIDGIEDEGLRTSVENVLDGATVNDLVNFGTLFYDGVMDLTPFKAKRPSDREGRASIAGFDENDTTLRGIVQTAQRLGKLVDLSKFREKFGERRRKKAGKGQSLGSRVKVIPEGFSEEEQSGIAEAFDTLDSVLELPESMRDIEIQVVGRGSAIERDILLTLPIYDSNLNQYTREEKMRLPDEELAAGFDRYVFEFAGANAMFIPPYNEGEKGILVMRPMSMRGGSAQEQFIESYVGDVVLPDGRSTSGLYIGDILHEMVHAIDGSDKDIKDIDGRRDYGETTVMALAETLLSMENLPPKLKEELTTNPSDLAYKISTNPGAVVDIARLYLPAEEFKKIQARDNRLRQWERRAGRELPASAGDPSLYLSAIFKKRLNDQNVSLDPKTRAFMEFYTRASETGSFKDLVALANPFDKEGNLTNGQAGYLASPHEILARGGAQYIALKALEKTGVDPRNYESFERDLKQLYSLAAKMKAGNLSPEERAVYDRLVQKVQQDWNDAFDELDDTQMNSLTTYLSLSAKKDQFSMLEMRDLTPFLDELMLNVGALPEEDDLPSRDVTPSAPPTRPPEAPPSGSIPLRPSFPSLTYSEDDYRKMPIDELMKYTTSTSAVPLGPNRFDENALSVLEERVKELSDEEIRRMYRPQDGRIIGVYNVGQDVINAEFSKRGLLRLSAEEQREVLMENLSKRQGGRPGRASKEYQESLLDMEQGWLATGDDLVSERLKEAGRLLDSGEISDEEFYEISQELNEEALDARLSDFGDVYGDGAASLIKDWVRDSYSTGFGGGEEDDTMAVRDLQAAINDFPEKDLLWRGIVLDPETRERMLESKKIRMPIGATADNDRTPLEYGGTGENGVLLRIEGANALPINKFSPIGSDDEWLVTGDFEIVSEGKHTVTGGQFPEEVNMWVVRPIRDGDSRIGRASARLEGGPPPAADEPAIVPPPQRLPFDASLNRRALEIDMTLTPELREQWDAERQRLIDLDIDPEMRERRMDQLFEELVRDNPDLVRTPPPGARPLGGDPDPLEGTFAYNERLGLPPPNVREGRASRWDMFEGGSRVEDPVYSTDDNQKVFGKLQTEVVDLEILNNPDGEGFVVAGQYLDFDDEANDLDFSGFYEFDSIEAAEDWANGLEAVLQESIDGYDDFEDYEDRLDRVLGNEIYTGAGTFSERVREGRASTPTPERAREGRASKPETGSQALAKVFADRWRKIAEQRGMVSEKSSEKLKTMLPESNEGTAKFIEIEHEQNPVFSKAMKNTLDTMFLKMLLNPQYAKITDDSKREKYIDENYSVVSYNHDLQELRGKLKEGGSLETNFVSNLNEDQKKLLRKLTSSRMAGRPDADPEALTDEEAKVFYAGMAQDAWAGTSQQFDLQLAAALESGMSDEDIIQSVFWQDFSKAEVYVATGDGKNPDAQTNLSNKEIGQLVLDAVRSDKMVVVQGEEEGKIKSVVIDPNSIPKAGSALLPQISFYDENDKLLIDTQLFGQGVNTFTFDKDTLAIHQGFLKARREQTIKNLKEAGITHVTLYRGMGDSAGVFEDGYDKGELAPLSSWSYRLGTATQFSSGEPNKTAVILEAAIPIEAIAGTSFDGFGCWTEEEVIVAAGKLDPELVGIKSFSLTAEGAWKDGDDIDLRGQNHSKNLALVEIVGRLFREAVSDPDYLSSEYEITQLANSVAAKYGLQGDANEILRYSPELREKVRKILSNISEGFVEDSLDIAGLQTSPQGFDTSES